MEFIYIDRKKRVMYLRLNYMLSALMILFATFFWRWGRSSTSETTIIEDFFEVEPYFRWIGWIGFSLCALLNYVLLPKIIRYQGGTMMLSKEGIEVLDKNVQRKLTLEEIKGIILTKDVPYEGDRRMDSQRGSRIQVFTKEGNYDWELKIESKKEFEELIPILNHWKDKVAEVQIKYKA